MTSKRIIPTIQGSAQARLLLYRLFSLKITHNLEKLLSTEPLLWKEWVNVLEAHVITSRLKKEDEQVLTQAFSHIEENTRRGLQRQIEHVTGQSLWLGVFPQHLLESFIDEHKKLIKSVQQEHLNKLGLTISRGLRDGRLQKDLAKDIRQVTDLSKRRAQLIARNATLQYSGALTKHHQISAGIQKYRWQTSQDERVRETHRDKNNTIYNWNTSGPHPRSEINCRCDAIPMLEDVSS